MIRRVIGCDIIVIKLKLMLFDKCYYIVVYSIFGMRGEGRGYKN